MKPGTDTTSTDCDGTGQQPVHLRHLNLFGCPSCRYAWDTDQPVRAVPAHAQTT